MLSFAEKAEMARQTGLPVVEGFAVRLTSDRPDGATHRHLEALLAQDLGGAFKAEQEGHWVSLRLPGGLKPPALGAAWEIVRRLEAVPGVDAAEPSLFVRNLEPGAGEAQRAFGLWGRVSDERAAQIHARSRGIDWAPNELELPAAWRDWLARHPGKEPGDGIVIAQLDTGYSLNPRFTRHLIEDAPGRFGRDFEDPGKPDALDPAQNFSGHGTRIGSVIVARREDGKPWGVAPGARIVPLRVSSTVIHLSFQNVSDAFVEAIKRRAHVITMSLGGPVAFRQLFDRVAQALDEGIIVVSAAGNKLPGVVFPARLPGVVACAASNSVRRPWRWSGLGDEVVITAPGELVWHDGAENGGTIAPPGQGDGTSYATAHMAGLAALWLSYHGRDALIQDACGGQKKLLPFLFRLCLKASAARTDFLDFGYGFGLARARALLAAPLPKLADIETERKDVLSRRPDHVFRPQGLRKILTLPTLTASLPAAARSRQPSEEESGARMEEFLAGDQGLVPRRLAELDPMNLAELATLAAADLDFGGILANVGGGARSQISAAAVRRHLLRKNAALSTDLRGKLEMARDDARRRWLQEHPELDAPAAPAGARKKTGPAASPSVYELAPPQFRRLRAYAFDPSLATSSQSSVINEITIPVVFERQLEPGPVGDYLEVVDVDPASDCAYAPVDLNHPYLLAQDGLSRSEGNPQFHQQMVYAVAMKTIGHFEEALGRPIFWSPLRPWDWRSGDNLRAQPRTRKKKGGEVADVSDQFVQRLRLYPHALRGQNAFYSPQKRAVLFGYFPAGESDPGLEFPGGVVFTCLAHDIIAHEMTHAILDGMHFRFIEPSNPDVFAFHEAFADIVALFQRFSYIELVEDQIAKSRGQLDGGTLLTRLALQFGQAIGRRQALRDALGHVIAQSREKSPQEFRDRAADDETDGGDPAPSIADTARDFDQETRFLWKRFKADPAKLAEVEEPHERGSFLVAAVFDAYLTIYESRVADLRRIATGGTGILPDGDLHPDLVRRMANEATLAARHVLKMCIRAMDYVPPTDITFGEYLRALITADVDLVPDDDRRYRVAFIEAFRKWGIYPRTVRTLSEETLRWSPPPSFRMGRLPAGFEPMRQALFDWQPGATRQDIFEKIQTAQGQLNEYIRHAFKDPAMQRDILGGIDTSRSFQVLNLRPARRIGPRGEFRTEMVVEILQRKDALPIDKDERELEKRRRAHEKKQRRRAGEADEEDLVPFVGGVTLIIGFEQQSYHIRYAIQKSLDSASRETRQREFLLRASGGGSGAAEYSSQGLPDGWFSRAEVRAKWEEGRNREREDMRASSCSCRRQKLEGKQRKGPVEPFALLHQL